MAQTGASSEGDGNKGGTEVERLRSELTQLSDENKSLRSQISGLEKHKRTAASEAKTLEQRVAELETAAEQANERAVKLERSGRVRDGIESAIGDIPEGKRKAARAIAQGLAADLDLGAQDNAAAVAKLQKTLKDEFSDVLNPQAPKQSFPHVPGPVNGEVPPKQAQGVSNARGERLI